MQQLQNYISKIREEKDKNLSLFLFLANSSMTQPGMKQKANMLYLSKEAIKMLHLRCNFYYLQEMMIDVLQKRPDAEMDFFWDQKGEFTITTLNFPENTLIYVNNGTTSRQFSGCIKLVS